ncbi:MAG: hypothetical protein K2Q01_05440, partial [Rickettsiales bacterium]|nr:hypothetical protein [Rickettsiales bacterium]
DSTKNLLKTFDSKQLVITPANPIAAVPPALLSMAELDAEQRLVISYKPSKQGIQDLLDAVKAAGISVQDLITREADLEDIFIHLTRCQDAA